MGMLIRRHRDRHSEDANPAPSKRKRSRKAAPKQVEPPKADDTEATKQPDTEPDPGAGGELVAGTDSPTEGQPDANADQLTESGSKSE